jgi:hypothetical protein
VTVAMDLTVPQYADLRAAVSVLGGPESLAGYTGHMQVRATQAAATTLADYASEIIIDPVGRTVSIVVLAAATAAYTWDSGVYDLVITGPDGTYRIAEGRIVVSKGVTH